MHAPDRLAERASRTGAGARATIVMTHDYPPLSGGGLALGVRELTRLLAGDHHVLVLSSRLTDHFADDRRCGPAAAWDDGASYALATAPRAVRSLLRADILLAHWTFSCRRLATISVILGPLLGKTTVCVIHTAPGHCEYNRLRHLPDWARRALLYLAANAMRRCAAVVALGPSHSAALAAAGLPATHVLPLMVSLPAAGRGIGSEHGDAEPARGRPDPSVPTIGIAGELSPLKGSERIPALLEALTPQFAFRIAGTGPLAARLARCVGDLPPEQRARVTMMGWIEPAKMPEFYRAVDFLLVLSRTEAQPRVILEAMLAEVIVVATRTTGVTDIVSDGVTGVFVDADDPRSCHRRLADLVGDPVQAAAIRGHAARFAAGRLQESGDRWRRFVAELLAE